MEQIAVPPSPIVQAEAPVKPVAVSEAVLAPPRVAAPALAPAKNSKIPRPGQIIKIQHSTQQQQKQTAPKATPMRAKQPVAPSAPAPVQSTATIKRLPSVVVKPVNPAKVIGRIPAPAVSRGIVRATPSNQPTRARAATSRPKSPTRPTLPTYHEKTPSFKSKPQSRSTTALIKPVPVQPLSKAINRKVPQVGPAPKPAVPKRTVAASTSQLPIRKAPVPTAPKRTQPQLPADEIPSPSRPMTYAQVAASPARPQKSFMRATAAMEAKQRSTLKYRTNVDQKKQAQEDLRARVLNRGKHLFDAESKKATPDTLRRLRAANAPTLTVPVTPPFVKRHARPPKSPVMTTEQREALEAARARQQFLEEQRKRREQWERKRAALTRNQ